MTEDVAAATGASFASAAVTVSWPRSCVVATDRDEDMAAESSIDTSRRPFEVGSRSENNSGEAISPAFADSLVCPETRSGSAAESGSTRSITVVSNAGAGRIEATSRMAPPVATTSAEPTTPPMISHRRPSILGPRLAALLRIGLLPGANVSASCEDSPCCSHSSLITLKFKSAGTLAGIRATVNRVCRRVCRKFIVPDNVSRHHFQGRSVRALMLAACGR